MKIRSMRLVSVMATVSMAAGLAAGAPRTGADFTRLANWSASTSRGRDSLPPIFSTEPQKDAAIRSGLAELIQTGAASAEGMCVTDDSAVRLGIGDQIPLETRLVLRLFLDVKAGRFAASSDRDHVEGLSSSAWFFYQNFFAAYAGLNPQFRRCDSPLARGVAALAAVNNTARGDLALLPDFKQEAAAALLLLNADPELVGLMRSSRGPADEALRARVEGAFAKALGPEAPVASMCAMLLGASDSGQPGGPSFDLRAVLGESDPVRDAAWRNALAGIPHPGLLAELGIAAWSGRTPDAGQASELDRVFETRMLGPLTSELRLRGISPEPASKKAAFDVSELTSIFGFVWTYRPEFEAWRQAARAAASLSGQQEREAKRRELISQLSTLLAPGSATAVPPAAALCSLVAVHPSSSGVSQPQIGLEYVERSIKGTSDQKPADKYIESAQVKLRWQLYRPLLGRGVETEEIVFSGSANAEAPEGLKTQTTKEVTTAPGEGKATSKGDDPKKPGPLPGQSTGYSGDQDGVLGQKGRGKTPSSAPKKSTEVRGFAPSASVLWRSGPSGTPTNAPVATACSNGLAGTVAANMIPRPPQPPTLVFATVWSEVAGAQIVPLGAACRIELENGKTVIAGDAQEFILFGATLDTGSKKAKALEPGDTLMGQDARPVRVTKVEQLPEPTLLIEPSMALYKNLLVEGVLAKVGVLEEVGGILPGTQVDIVPGTVPVEKLKADSLVSAHLEEEAGAVPTRVKSVRPKKVNSYAELRYDIDGTERTLRIAATQKVLVWIPQASYQTYACANPKLAKTNSTEALVEPDKSDKPPEPTETDKRETLALVPGMLLVTATTGKNQAPITTPLKSIVALGDQPDGKVAAKKAEGQIDTIVPELVNLSLLRAEGVLLHCATDFETVSGFALDATIVQPPEGTPPGAPLGFSDKASLPAIGIQALPCPEGPFLTAKWPEKTWLAGRTTAIPRNMALRCVRIETDRGVLFCGNIQLFPAIRKGRGPEATPRVVEALAEELTHAPELYELFFVNREAPRSDGELERVPVRAAKFVYGQRPTMLAEVVGEGAAGRVERQETGPDGKPVKKLISRDIYFVNGFMALSENEESTSGGGSLSGGGGGPGKVAPDQNVSKEEARVSFDLPGLEAGNRRTRENRLLFSDDERARFDARLQELQQAYGQARWGQSRVKDEKRFIRFLSLYFAPQGLASLKNPKQLEAMYAEPSTNGAAPAWTSIAYREYVETRASLIEHGIPSDLYGWSFRYAFLVTVAYETGNSDLGDALLKDFLCLSMSVALGRHEEQVKRQQYYFDPRYRLAEALHWSRDVVSIVRNNEDGRQAWVRPDGWDELLKSSLKELTDVGGVRALQREDGAAEIGNLWVQLRKRKHGDGVATQAQPGLDPELAEQVQAAAAGQDENRTLFLIVSPSQNPAAAFDDGEFTEGPYPGQTIRKVLGIKVTSPSL